MKWILHPDFRIQWDTSILRIDRVEYNDPRKTMLLLKIRTEPLVSELAENSIVIKHFVFRHGGSVFVYFSSVVEEEFFLPLEEWQCQVFGLWCFEQDFDRVTATLFEQVDFLELQNKATQLEYLHDSEAKLFYWYEKLSESLLQEPGMPYGYSIATLIQAVDYIPSEEEVQDFARYLGMDARTESDLFYIAKEGLQKKLPFPWQVVQKGSEVRYYNLETHAFLFENPGDSNLRKIFLQEKKRRRRR